MILRMARLSPLAIVAMLAACEPVGSDMGTLTGPMPQAPPPIVVRDQQRHLVLDLAGSGGVGDRDWARLDNFLGSAAVGRPDTVRLTIAGDASPLVIDLVIRHALAFGYAENKIEVAPPTMARRSYRAELDLTARTYVAVLPNCPQTTHLNLIDRDNQVSSDWGCATVSTLEQQVADPRDLVRGEDGGETDSVLTTAAIHRLQTDKVKKLEGQSPTASVTSGGSQ
jgi:pilus assembly protein CpaD